MNCKRLLTTLLCLASLHSFSQDEEKQDAESFAKATFLNPGIGYELRIAKWQTLNLQGFMNLSSYAQNNNGELDIDFYFDPAVTLQYRFYYNGVKRLEAEKRIAKNSMNYVALVGESTFSKMPLTTNSTEEKSRRMISRYGVVWGLQRNSEKHFSFDFNIGLGYLTGKSTPFLSTGKTTVGQVTLLGQLNLGFWFGGN